MRCTATSGRTRGLDIITVRGVRQHNLHSIDLDLRKRQWIVVGEGS